MITIVSNLKEYYKQLTAFEQQSFPGALKQTLENPDSSNLAIVQAALTCTLANKERFIGLRNFFSSPYISALLVLKTAGLLNSHIAHANFNTVVSSKFPEEIAQALLLRAEIQSLRDEMFAPSTTSIIAEAPRLKKEAILIGASDVLENRHSMVVTQDLKAAAYALTQLNEAGLLSTVDAQANFNAVVSNKDPRLISQALILRFEMRAYDDKNVVLQASSVIHGVMQAVVNALALLNETGLLEVSDSRVNFNKVLTAQDPLAMADSILNQCIMNTVEQLDHALSHHPYIMAGVVLTDDVRNAKNLINKFQAVLSKRISMPIMAKLPLEKVLCYALENQYSIVSNFFLKAVDISFWLQQGLADKDERLLRALVRKLMTSRMADPYDLNDQHIVGATPARQSLPEITEIEFLPAMNAAPTTALALNNAKISLQGYDQGRPLSDEALLALCGRLETPHSPRLAEIKVHELSKRIQTALITRHNQYIMESKDTLSEQEWFAPKPENISFAGGSLPASLTVVAAGADLLASASNLHPVAKVTSDARLSVFEKVLSTLKLIGLFKKPEIELMEKVVQQFKQLANEGWHEDQAQALLVTMCDLLGKSGIESAKTLEQAYLRPLLYLLDDEQKTIPGHAQLPISREKLMALKQLYQAVISLHTSPAPAMDVYVAATGKILHALLVLTDQEPVLLDWLSGVLTGKYVVGDTVTQLLKYVAETQDGLSQWMDNLTELDQLMNRAAFDALNGSLDKAQKTVCLAIERIIFYIHEQSLEEDDRQALMADIENYIDLSQIGPQYGMTRHYPLLIIAAQYYEMKQLSKASNHLLSIAFTLRFMHQLSVVRNMSQLLVLAQEIREPVLSGNFGNVPQILAFGGIVYTVLTNLKAAENKVDFCSHLIHEIEGALPETLAWRDTVMPWLATAKIILDSYPLLNTSLGNRLGLLKEQEKIIKQYPMFSEEGRAVLRLLVSAQYLSELPGFIQGREPQHWSSYFPIILANFVQPVAIVWEQHDVTAATVLMPQLLESVTQISKLPENELSIENYLTPILAAMREAHGIFANLEHNGLLDCKASSVCIMVNTGKNYLEVGSALNKAFQTGKVIFKRTKALKFCVKGLISLADGVAGAADSAAHIESIITAIQDGDAGAAQAAIEQLPGVVSALGPANSTAGHVAQAAGNTAMSMLGVVTAVAAIANIGVTIYYSEIMLSEMKVQAAQSLANHKELIENHRQLAARIEGISGDIYQLNRDIDQKFILLINSVELSFHNVMSHQQQMLGQVETGLDRLRRGIERLDENAVLRELEKSAFDIYKQSSTLEQAVKREWFFMESAKEALPRLYQHLVCSKAGLRSGVLNGTRISNADRARNLLFLQPLFNEPLPNLGYWMHGCREVNHFLNQFSELPPQLQWKLAQELKLQSLRYAHIDAVWITYDILQALRVITTKRYIVGLLGDLRQDPTNIDKQQHLHQVAKLCGFPLHQFGEMGFELWPKAAVSAEVGQPLSEVQQEQKQFLETLILETLEGILESNDSARPCSSFTLSVQSLLMELVNVGHRVFPEFATKLFEGQCSRPPLLQALVSNVPERRLFLAQNPAAFFELSHQKSTQLCFEKGASRYEG